MADKGDAFSLFDDGAPGENLESQGNRKWTLRNDIGFKLTGIFDVASYNDGFADGVASVPELTFPIISDIEPADSVEPGEPGAFSATFKVARLTPITFHLAELPDGAEVSISVKFNNRNETYTARNADGEWLWPFDLAADNVVSAIVDGECDVSILPRGGWPPTRVEFNIAGALLATEAP